MIKSKLKRLLITFFDVKELVHYEFVPEGQTINRHYYIDVLRRLREAMFVACVLLLIYGTKFSASYPCPFNKLCTCKTDTHEVICKKLSLSIFPPVDNVFKIEVPENDLEVLPMLPRLYALDVSHNRLKYVSPEALRSSWEYLSSLDVSYNELEVLPSLQNFSRLEWLNARENHVSSVKLSGPHSALGYLSLSGNHLTSLSDGAFSGLPSLAHIGLDSNFISSIEGLPFPSRVDSILLSDNLLDNVPSSFMSNLPFLNWFILSGNLFEKTPPLQETINITKLFLNSNRIKEITNKEFGTWSRQIKYLNLGSNNILYLHPNVFSNIHHLSDLILSNNPLAAFSPLILSDFRNSLNLLEMGSSWNATSPGFELLNLHYLQLDHNNITDIRFIRKYKNLIFCDLESNRIKDISNIFSGRFFPHIRTILLSSNYIEKLNSYSFGNMHQVNSIYLLGNRIRTLRRLAFANCTNLMTIVLSWNQISWIENAAFYNLSKIETIYLDFNRIKAFNFDWFIQFRHIPFNFNLSANEITSMNPSKESGTVNEFYFRDLDMNFNFLTSISEEVLIFIKDSIEVLHLSHNSLSNISINFELFNLHQVYLDNNEFKIIQNNYFRYFTSVQKLYLNKNNIRHIESGSFGTLINLRILDLNDNNLHELDSNIFRNTSIESLGLANNKLKSISGDVFFPIRYSLSRLDLSGNLIKALDLLYPMDTLLSLNLSHNYITSMAEISWNYTRNLFHLDISSNHIANLKSKYFSMIDELVSLNLGDNNLTYFPPLDLPYLRLLRLSGNRLVTLSEYSFERLSGLRELDVSRCQLQEVPGLVWPHVWQLRRLNLADNPVGVLGPGSFSGLSSLLELDLRGLELRQADTRTLHNLRGAEATRRPRPTTGLVPRAEEIKITRAHIAEARARQASSAEDNYVYVEYSPELEPFHYLSAVDRMVGGASSVAQIAKINGHYLLGLVNRGLAERLISEGLEIEGTLLRAFPFRRRAVRITLGNLPLFVEDSAISSALAPYGRVTSIAPKLMKAGPYIYNDGRREAFIALHEGVTTERLPTRLEIKIKGEVWPAYLSYGIRCSRCHGQGHRRANCPLLAGRSNAPGPATPTSPTGVPPVTAPRLPRPPSTQSPPLASPSPAMEVSDAPSTSRAALHPPAALRQSPPVAPAVPTEMAPPSSPPVTPAPFLRAPGSHEPAVPTPDIEMSIIEETSTSSTSSSKTSTREGLVTFIERNPGISFAQTDALGLGREEVLDILSSKTKARKRGPLLSPSQCGALAGLIRQLLGQRPGGDSNIYKVLRQVLSELRTAPTAVPSTPPLPAPRPSGPTPPTSHSEELMPAVMTPPPPAPTEMEEDNPMTEKERCAPPPPAPRLAEPTPPTPHGEELTPAMATPPPPLPFLTQVELETKCVDRIFDLFKEQNYQQALGPLLKKGLDIDNLSHSIVWLKSREYLLKSLRSRPRHKASLAEFLGTVAEHAHDDHPLIQRGIYELRLALRS
ncbi:hypothetical protein LAZ67_13001109 [Cordylochernes scorpioides]|uniref:Uncharacterized protein n=1 Tax=Cordylochernes scorpioides TaxID=51811 RepID=A0ABY6L3J4_9ARAC|nr:hypothetical protein LAZ67_13001109 [Cordylochernes scorpioides]